MRPHHLGALGSVALALTAALPAQRHIFTYDGESPNTFFGWSVDLGGDLDADGYPDILVGAPGLNANGTIASTIFVWSGKHGGMIHCRNGDFDGDKYGQAIAGLGDIDGDGRPDFAVGIPRNNANGALSGSVRLYSGASYKVITTLHGGSPGESYGISVHGVGDVDGDGRNDFVAGGPGETSGTGVVRVISGKTLKPLYVWRGTTAGALCGHIVRSAGDVDGDGVGDVVFGAPGAGAGYAEVRSGKTGAKLYALSGSKTGDAFGFSVAGVGDLDADGHAEFAVGAPRADFNGIDSGRVQVFSGKTGKPVYTLDGDSRDDLFGASVSGIGDYDRDRRPDFAVGAVGDARNGPLSGSVFVVSGKTGRSLGIHSGDAAGDLFGSSIAPAGDANKDGHADLIVGAVGNDVAAFNAGNARLISGAPLTLESSENIMSLGKGGSHTYTVRAGAAHANRHVVVVGSMTDIAKGFTVGGIRVPVDLDAYTQFTLNKPNLLAGSRLIRLDGNGNATFKLTLPPGLDPAMQRTAWYHAAVVVSTMPFGVHFATNPVAMFLNL